MNINYEEIISSLEFEILELKKENKRKELEKIKWRQIALDKSSKIKSEVINKILMRVYDFDNISGFEMREFIEFLGELKNEQI